MHISPASDPVSGIIGMFICVDVVLKFIRNCQHYHSLFVGGLIIGSASTALLYFTGKLTGISGILHDALTKKPIEKSKNWTYTYLLGLVSSGAMIKYFAAGNASSLNTSTMGLVIGGLLVGYGTRLASGCTSGHGICGLPRFSMRSLTAVGTFMGTGMLTAYLRSNNAFVQSLVSAGVGSAATATSTSSYIGSVIAVFMFSSALFALPSYFQSAKQESSLQGHHDPNSHVDLIEHVVSFLSAFLFGLGLIYSGMSNPDRVMGFLDITSKSGWDITLIGVMGGGVVLNTFSFQYLYTNVKSIVLNPTKLFKSILTVGPFSGKNALIDARLVVGSAMFGAGWGLTGVCPGPAMVLLGMQVPGGEVLFSALSLGMILFEVFSGHGSPWFKKSHHHSRHGEHSKSSSAPVASTETTEKFDS
jgi:uncharacterized protein